MIGDLGEVYALHGCSCDIVSGAVILYAHIIHMQHRYGVASDNRQSHIIAAVQIDRLDVVTGLCDRLFFDDYVAVESDAGVERMHLRSLCRLVVHVDVAAEDKALSLVVGDDDVCVLSLGLEAEAHRLLVGAALRTDDDESDIGRQPVVEVGRYGKQHINAGVFRCLTQTDLEIGIDLGETVDEVHDRLECVHIIARGYQGVTDELVAVYSLEDRGYDISELADGGTVADPLAHILIYIEQHDAGYGYAHLLLDALGDIYADIALCLFIYTGDNADEVEVFGIGHDLSLGSLAVGDHLALGVEAAPRSSYIHADSARG